MRAIFVAVAASAVTLAACGGSASTSSQHASASVPRGPRIAARVADYRIKIDNYTAPSGAVRIDIRNDGRVVHELVIIKSGYAADVLPRDGNAVSVYDAGTVLDSTEVAPGRTAAIKANLTPGTYVLICDLADHYVRGMRTAFRTA